MDKIVFCQRAEADRMFFIPNETRSVSANDMFVQFNARKGNTLQGRERGESASLSLIPY